MDIKSLIKYCRIQKQKKFETAIALLQKKRYADCLFFCHLALEFAFKEKAVEKTKKPFPITHDLEDISIKAQLTLSKLQRKHLAIINTFNIAGRYDDYKLSFYKKATPQFAKKYFKTTKDLLLWLEKK